MNRTETEAESFAGNFMAFGEEALFFEVPKIVRNEIFKEIWNEIDRLDQGVSATRGATARSAAAA